MQRPIQTYTDNYGQTIEFTIPSPHTKICINISGGADSAILLYMLIRYCEKYIPTAEIHVITSANSIKGWKNAKWSTTVVDRILQIFYYTTLIKSHYTFYSDDQRRSELDDAEKMIKKRTGITFTIHGTTQNPPLEVSKAFGLEQFKGRDPGHGRTTMSNGFYVHARYMPFMNADKRMVAYLFKHFNMLEELFPFTRSCEWQKGNTTARIDAPEFYVDVANPGDKHCGECWWCKEREWAFGRL